MTDSIRHRWSLLLFAAAVVALTAACSSAPSTSAPPASAPAATSAAGAPAAPVAKKVLRTAIFGEPGTLDFMQEGDMAATIVDWNIYDQLARWNYDKGVLEPELATGWKQESPTSWLVTLRHGVQFQKGYGEMTAEDVAFGVNNIIQNNTRIKFLYAGVKNVEVVDKYTVRYNLSYPNTPFLQSVIQGFGGLVLSKAAFQKLGADAFARNPVGAGPFEFGDWVSGDHITLKKFDQYWDKGNPKVDEVNIRFVPDPSVKENLLKSGQVDLIDSVPYNDLEAMKADPTLTVQTIPGWNWDYVSFGTNKGPMGSSKVRQAISYALDRDAIAKAVYYGYAIPGEKPLPPGFMFRDDTVTRFTSKPNIAKAKQLMAEAGYPNGFDMRGIAPAEKDAVKREAQIIVEQLKPIGVNIKLEFLDQAAYSKIQRSPGDFIDFNQITIMSPDPDSAINWFWHTGGSLARDYSNPEVDALIDKGRTLTDPGERQAVYKQLQQKMLDESWYIYTVHRQLVKAMTKKVTGYKITPQDMDFRLKYVDLQ